MFKHEVGQRVIGKSVSGARILHGEITQQLEPNSPQSPNMYWVKFDDFAAPTIRCEPELKAE